MIIEKYYADRRTKIKGIEFMMRNNALLYLPFSDMEDSRSSHCHRDQSGFSARRYPGASARRQTCLRDVLQTPVPVIVIV